MHYYLNRYILLIILVAIILLLNSRSIYADKVSCASSLLPKDAIEEISKKYRGWRILEIEDLVVDDRIIWRKYHNDKCPSVIFGKYDGSDKITYAVLLIREISKKKQAKVLLLRKVTEYDIKVLYEEDNIINYPVIYNGKPGVYYDFYDKTLIIKIKTGAIIYEHLEASAIVFYFRNGKYHHLLISD